MAYYGWMRFVSNYFTNLGNDVSLCCFEVFAIILIVSELVYHYIEQPSRCSSFMLLYPLLSIVSSAEVVL